MDQITFEIFHLSFIDELQEHVVKICFNLYIQQLQPYKGQNNEYILTAYLICSIVFFFFILVLIMSIVAQFILLLILYTCMIKPQYESYKNKKCMLLIFLCLSQYKLCVPLSIMICTLRVNYIKFLSYICIMAF